MSVSGEEGQPMREFDRQEVQPSRIRQDQNRSMPEDTGAIKAQLDERIMGVKYDIYFEAQPFAKGALRMAFKGVFKGNGELNEKQCVTKIFLDDEHSSKYQADLRASRKAKEFAEEFETYAKANWINKPVNSIAFIVPEVATVTKVPPGNIFTRRDAKILVEYFIEDFKNYEKFNSNGGWEKGEIPVLNAFSHFTYQQSNGDLIVCDIQGVRMPSSYTLTDPAIHSRTQGAYGLTDLGPVGMSWFFAGHECSKLCEKFQTPALNKTRRIGKGKRDRRTSSYTSMLSDDEKAVNEYYSTLKELPDIMEEPVVTQESAATKKPGEEGRKHEVRRKGIDWATLCCGFGLGVVAMLVFAKLQVKTAK